MQTRPRADAASLLQASRPRFLITLSLTLRQNSDPIWLPHWPTWRVMISRGMASERPSGRARAVERRRETSAQLFLSLSRALRLQEGEGRAKQGVCSGERSTPGVRVNAVSRKGRKAETRSVTLSIYWAMKVVRLSPNLVLPTSPLSQ